MLTRLDRLAMPKPTRTGHSQQPACIARSETYGKVEEHLLYDAASFFSALSPTNICKSAETFPWTSMTCWALFNCF